MRTSLNHQPEVHHPKSPAIRWAADYPIFTPDCVAKLALRRITNGDSVGMRRSSAGVGYDGGAGRRARPVLLFL
jgi:hypothetical protein